MHVPVVHYRKQLLPTGILGPGTDTATGTAPLTATATAADVATTTTPTAPIVTDPLGGLTSIIGSIFSTSSDITTVRFWHTGEFRRAFYLTGGLDFEFAVAVVVVVQHPHHFLYPDQAYHSHSGHDHNRHTDGIPRLRIFTISFPLGHSDDQFDRWDSCGRVDWGTLACVDYWVLPGKTMCLFINETQQVNSAAGIVTAQEPRPESRSTSTQRHSRSTPSRRRRFTPRPADTKRHLRPCPTHPKRIRQPTHPSQARTRPNIICRDSGHRIRTTGTPLPSPPPLHSSIKAARAHYHSSTVRSFRTRTRSTTRRTRTVEFEVE
ncbi:hypothetical protein C8F04DRAFT_1139332 [Mycena alexandri]|uniref:Uncharacterized protein n=1 Tax=Mycena alexandri TaxID=1745969 RepID=A0AAD6S7Z3_9AGAR|nr:hypothetical protein C8F04DRAFT_1139332 [Mycena alexandri]